MNIQVFSRHLERFLYAHEIVFVSSHRTYDGAMVWEYVPDDFTRHVVAEWKEVQERRQHRLGKKERQK